MNKEELKKLQEGSVIYVPYIVDYVQVGKNHVMAVLPREKRGNEEESKAILPVHVFCVQDIQRWEAPLRWKFKPGDIVRCYNEIAIVVSYEDEKGQVLLKGEGIVDAEKLTLLISAREVNALVEEKGGEND